MSAYIARQQAVPKPAMSEGHRCMLQYPGMLHLGSVHNMRRLSQLLSAGLQFWGAACYIAVRFDTHSCTGHRLKNAQVQMHHHSWLNTEHIKVKHT